MRMYGISNSSATFSPNLALLWHLIEQILSKICQSTENTKSLLFRPDALYILGTHITIETDHKPLIPLLNTKSLDGLPPRILRFRLRLSRFGYTVQHIPGKLLYMADALSRAPTGPPEEEKEEEIERYINAVVMPALPASQPAKARGLPASPEGRQRVCGSETVLCRGLARETQGGPSSNPILEGAGSADHMRGSTPLQWQDSGLQGTPEGNHGEDTWGAPRHGEVPI